MTSRLFCAGLVFSCIALAACGAPEQTLPEGPQTVRGFLESVKLSRVRRGTHAISDGGTILYYAESRTVDLRALEGEEVLLEGTLEPNTDPESAPVLVVTAARAETAGEFVAWNVPELQAAFSAPKTWSGSVRSGQVQFTLTGSLSPILTVYSDVQEPLLSVSEPMMLQGISAQRSIDEKTGNQTIVVKRAKSVLVFLFTPKDLPPAVQDALRRDFLRLLRSVTLLSGSSSSGSSGSSSRATTGSGSTSAGMPCGGPAGVLCPQGYICTVTDPATGIGSCHLRKS